MKVVDRTAEITSQKSVIEVKNQDITASIKYAKRIQDALLPSEKVLKENVDDYFILLKPRDIVSGDFYWVAHNFDIGQWGINNDSAGPINIIPAGFEEKEFLTYEYENGVIMTNEPWNAESTRGVKFWGTDGWVEVRRGGYAASDDSLLPPALDDANAGLKYESGTGYLGNFIECIKSRQEPVANIEIGQRTVATCILGNIASELGRPVAWNPGAQDFVDDAEAAKFFHREYREGYTL